MTNRSGLLRTPVEPFLIDPDLRADEILERMERISFQGRSLATAHRVWRRMLADEVTIFLGVAGALSAGGLRMILAYLIEHRFVDCVVSTGANLYHDLHETRGRHHYLGSATADDVTLQAEHVDRVYDTYASEAEFVDNDAWIAEFASALEPRAYTTRELLYRLGEHLWSQTRTDGILTAAYRARVPVFCPAIADSSIGLGLSQARHKGAGATQVDVVGDIVESANLVIRRPRTASVVLGGGTPKNFINQATVQAAFFNPGIRGHEHALQIVTDVPYFGGASGSTLEEAQSWGKLTGDASQVTVYADVTIALPLLANALARSAVETAAARPRPIFDLGQRAMLVDGVALGCDRFEEPR
jgi:deoxyhypusine synthase